MAAGACGISRRRARRAGHAAGGAVSVSDRHDDDRRLAHRRVGCRDPRALRQVAPSRQRLGRGEGRLVARLRLSHRRTVVAGRGIPRRSRSVRLGAAARRRRPAGGAGDLHRRWIFPGAPVLDGGTEPHSGSGAGAVCVGISARGGSVGLSLEQFRHGLRLESPPGADRIGGRRQRPHHARRRHLRRCGAARRSRQGRGPPSKTVDIDGCSRPGFVLRAARLRRSASRGSAAAGPARCPSAHHAAQPAAGREIPRRQQGRDPQALSRSLRPGDPRRKRRAQPT